MLQSIKQDFFNFKTLSPQVKFLLLFQLVVLFIVSLLVGFIFSPERSSIISRPINKSQARANNLNGTTLKISPEETVFKVGQEQTFTVELAGEPVPAADIVLTFDPKYLQISAVAPDEQFDNIIVNSIEGYKLFYSANYSPDKWPQAKPGRIFTFKVRAIDKTEETKISIVKDSTSTSRDNKNTLTETVDAIVRVYD